MSNFTFKLENCKIFGYGCKDDKSKAWGKLHWTAATSQYEFQFETIYRDVIECLEANKGPEASFKVSGGMMLSLGYGQFKGKAFNKFLVDKVERV